MEHRYDNLLKEIIGIVRNDYAGFDEKKERHDSRYYVNTAGTAWKQGILDEKRFLRIVSQYLASLGDPCLKFSMFDHDKYRNYDVGFRARRYGDYLYVTESRADERFRPGDQIERLNSMSPGDHQRKMAKNIFIGQTAEREQWNGLLKMVKHCTVEHLDGTKEDIELKHYPLQDDAAAPSFSIPKEGVCCIRVERFDADEAALADLIAEHAADLTTCEKLIIDVRKNAGGNEEGFLPLLPLVMDRPYRPVDLLDADPVISNYSEGNCSRRIQEFTSLKAQFDPQTDADTIAVLDDLIREFGEKSGKGWLADSAPTAGQDSSIENTAAGDPAQLVQPYSNIRSVLVLTDTWCRDSGEAFVDIARRSSKVRLFGRPTMGTIDYTNYVNLVLDNTFVLSYPMGKKARVNDGERYNETGLPVDIYRPFTPGECTQDLLMERALTYI